MMLLSYYYITALPNYYINDKIAAAAAAAGVLSMTTVGKGDDAETVKARISAILSESNKSPSHKSSSNINIRDKYSATVPKMLIQKKNVQLQKLV